MKNDVIISVENLGKKYRIAHQAERQRYVALRDVIAQKLNTPFQFLKRSQRSVVRGQTSDLRPPNSGQTSDLRPPTSGTEDFWALKDVSFEVKRGDVVGIIGRNGAGKSTLLKILSRITEPTTGRVHLRGRVASLLEVGTGFHPELTGRENIYLNGAILGMSRAEIRKKFDEIVAFAEVEKFLDTPVKRYSSGMYVRLAFAVAAHLEPEILIVDEVLAVGDSEFQKKCLGKMESVATQEGRTVLFVSHNMGAVTQLCSRGLLIGEGQIKMTGSADEVVRAYTRTVPTSEITDIAKQFRGPLTSKLHFESLRIESKNGLNTTLISPASPIRIEAIVKCTEDIPAFRMTLAVFCNGVRLFSTHDVPHAETIKAGSHFKSSFVLPAHFLRPADYFVALGGHSATNGEWLWATDLAQFSILEEWGDNFRAYDTGLINMAQRGERALLAKECHS
jgi:lipopolysaccharide transport system ATP-binding protein